MINPDYIEELKKYAELEGSELGEALGELCHIANYADYLSDVFFKAVEKEIIYQLDFLKKNTRIIKRQYTQEYTHEELDDVRDFMMALYYDAVGLGIDFKARQLEQIVRSKNIMSAYMDIDLQQE